MLNKEIIIKTLEHINNKGYVDVISFWTDELQEQQEIKDLLVKGELVNVLMGQPYTFEITNPKGVALLKNPKKLNDDGTLKKSIKSKLNHIKDKYWVLILILTYLLGIFSPILTDIIKVQLPEEWFKRKKTTNSVIKKDSIEVSIPYSDSTLISPTKIE